MTSTRSANVSGTGDLSESRSSRRDVPRSRCRSPGDSRRSSRGRGGSRSSSAGSTGRREISAEERRLQKAYFEELLEKAGSLQLSRDNRWRRFDETFSTIKALRAACRKIAKLRARQVCYVTDLVSKEEAEEAERVRRERAVKSLPSRLVDLKRLHEEQRKTVRLYIEQVRYQNEVVLMTRMREEGLLW